MIVDSSQLFQEGPFTMEIFWDKVLVGELVKVDRKEGDHAMDMGGELML